jgi:hypothetical protein
MKIFSKRRREMEMVEKGRFGAGDVLHFLVERDSSVFVGKSFGGRYVVESVLGSTYVSVLLLARRRGLGDCCVIKVLLEDEPDSKLHQRFYREVRSLRELRHSAVVKLEDAGIEDGVPYYVMELLRGPNLHEYVAELRSRGEELDLGWVRRTFAAIADGLVHCHHMGVLHRDVKPENVVIDRRHDLPVLVDFGLAKQNPEVDGEGLTYLSGELTTAGEMLGTPAYQSPEQVDPGGDFGGISAATDVWGFGAMLFYCLTGETPYSERTVLEIYVSLLNREPRDIEEFGEDLPEDLVDLCRRCLVKDSSQRPSMEEVRDALSGEGRALGFSFLRLPLAVLLGLVLPFVFLLSVGLLLKVVDGGGLKFEELGVAKKLTRKSEVRLFGRVNVEDCVVFVGGQGLRVRGGEFDCLVALTEGVNVIVVWCEVGGRTLRRTLVVERDSVKPRLFLGGERAGDLYLGEAGVLEGQVRDDHVPSFIRVNGMVRKLSEDGLFRVEFGGSYRGMVCVEFEDRAGNRLSRSYRVKSGEWRGG